MSRLTLRVVQGADRGRVFSDLKTPISIGREEGNTIQLNDERISRFHCKIQEDNSHLVLTDLESTNGTRVNGQDCQLRILRFGDLILLGRSVLLFGSHDQILSRIHEPDHAKEEGKSSSGNELEIELDSDLLKAAGYPQVQSHESPQLPQRLSPSQAAQLAELFEYFHSHIGEIVDSVNINDKKSTISVDLATWQHLLQVYSRISELIRGIGDPDFRLPG
jgi:pSer/pThr/pTyr-binding forkhead associated (FHA) protein